MSFEEESIEQDHDTYLEASNEEDEMPLEDILSCRYNPLKELQEEHQSLNNSLLLLSSQFAQVQFRLRQIANSDGKTKEDLLQDLHDYAFKGVNEFEQMQKEEDGAKSRKILERQSTLINSMRDKLEELEKQAEQEGKTNNRNIIKKQKSALEKLNEKMKLSLEISDLSSSEIQMHADEAIREFMNPFKEKQELVEQLQIQIVDLERFVNVLQNEALNNISETNGSSPAKSFKYNYSPEKKQSTLFGFGPFGSKKFQKNQLKHSSGYNHYGDERAHLELAVHDYEKVLEKYTLLIIENPLNDEEQLTSSNDESIFKQSQEEVVAIVRKRLAPTLKALLEHGMRPVCLIPGSNSAFGCFSSRNRKQNLAKPTDLKHVWDVITYFYELNNGDDRIGAVPRLSQTFGLDIIAGRSMTSKEQLLATIEEIISTHTKLRRSKDSQWKAFISAALNLKKLPSWIRIMFRTRQIVENCYYTYSYVARTGCDELNSLFESLHKYNVCVPVDLALKPFEQIKEAF